MKARDYAARITGLENPEVSDIIKELGKVGKDFYNEFVDIKNKRKLQRGDSLCALIFEFDKKFHAFARLVNEKYMLDPVRPDGFLGILKIAAPELVEVMGDEYENYKQDKL